MELFATSKAGNSAGLKNFASWRLAFRRCLALGGNAIRELARTLTNQGMFCVIYRKQVYQQEAYQN